VGVRFGLLYFVSGFRCLYQESHPALHQNQITDLFSGLLIGTLIAIVAYSLSFVIINNYLLLFAQLVVAVCVYIYCRKKNSARVV